MRSLQYSPPLLNTKTGLFPPSFIRSWQSTCDVASNEKKRLNESGSAERRNNMLTAAFRFQLCVIMLLATTAVWAQPRGKRIVHDAEYYILEAQNGERWSAEDRALNATARGAAQEARNAAEHRPHHVGRYGLWRRRDSRNPNGARLEDSKPKPHGPRRHAFHPYVHRGGLYSQPRRLHDRPPSHVATRCTTSECCARCTGCAAAK